MRAMFVALVVLLLTGSGLAEPALAGKSKKSKSSAGDVIKAPSGTPRNLLHVFLPGTGYSPGAQSAYLDFSATDLGFHTIGLSYKNSKAINSYCKDGNDKDCEEKVRREIIYGTNSSNLISVSPGQSVVGRLTSVLTAKMSEPGWGQFLADGAPDWTKIVLSGHSQGAGHVAIMAQDEDVARVALLAGPNDGGRGSNTSSRWVDNVRATPEAEWYALGHVDDASKARQLDAWLRLEIPNDKDQAEVPTGTHRLFTTLEADERTRGHESVVIDQYLVPDKNSPELEPTWESLLTDGLGASATATQSLAAPSEE